MRHYLNWKQYTQVPEIKSLIEEKGLDAAKKRYHQDLNKWQLNDPMIKNI